REQGGGGDDQRRRAGHAAQRGPDDRGARPQCGGHARPGDGGNGGRGRGPGDLIGEVLRGVIGERGGRGELLGRPRADVRIGRRHGDRDQGGGADRQDRRAGDTVERGTDGRGAGRHRRGQPRGADRGDRWGGRRPGHLAGQVLR